VNRAERFNAAVEAAFEAALEMEPQLEAVYERAVRRAGDRLARAFSEAFSVVLAAGDWTPPELPELDLAELGLARQRREEAAGILEAQLAERIAGAGISFDAALFSVFSPDLLESLAQHAGANFDAEMRRAAGSAIHESFDAGLSVPDTAKAIRQSVRGTSAATATMLARTDLVALANGGSYMAARQVFEGATATKRWLSTGDARTRPTHVAANGQEVPLEQPFQVGGFPLLYPGDPQGPPAEVIQCRCTLTYAERAAASPSVPPEPVAPPLPPLEPSPTFRTRIERSYRETWGPVGAREKKMTVEQYEAELLRGLRAKTEAAEVRIRTPAEVAEQVLDDGRFRSQFETKTSRGMLSRGTRESAEEHLFGYKPDLPDAERPIYGYLSTTEGAAQLEAYGEVAWTLKPAVRARTTFTADDSLGLETIPAPVEAPNVLAIPRPRYSTDPERLDALNLGAQKEFNEAWTYWEAQIHKGVSVDDVERVDIWDGMVPAYDYPGAPSPQPYEWAARLRDKLVERGIHVEIHEDTSFRRVVPPTPHRTGVSA
jgi:hypothetical protein